MQQTSTRLRNEAFSDQSNVEDEYRALTAGVALVDRSDLGRLNVTGEDALDLLNRLSTNELMTLEIGRGVSTILTTNKGRIVDLLQVFRFNDRLLVTTSPTNQQKVIEWIDFYTFVEDVAVEDLTTSTKTFSVVGPASTTVLDELTNGQVSALGLYDLLEIEVAGIPVQVYRTDFLGVPSFDLVVDVRHSQRTFDALTNGGAVAVGDGAVETVRIENGIPAFGKELTESYNPHEANLIDFVSFSKGCYIGQEVIARLQTYKKVQKYLVGLRWGSSDLSSGTKLILDRKQVGVVTSVSRSPVTGDGIGLGYARKEFAEDGATVTTEDSTVVTVSRMI